MKIKIPMRRAIEYILIFWCLFAILLVGPMGAFDKTREAATSRVINGTTEMLCGTDRIQQVFLADGGFLEKIAVYADNNLSGRVVHFSVYDETGEMLMNRDFALDDYDAPGYFVLPVEFQTVPNRAYVWQISSKEEGLYLNWQNTAQSGVTWFGNFYYATAEGNIREQVAKNIVCKFIYSAPLSRKVKAAFSAAMVLLAALMTAALEVLYRRKNLFAGRVKLQRVIQGIGDPLVLGTAAAGLWWAVVKNVPGGYREDRVVWAIGILLPTLLFLYVINRPAGKYAAKTFKRPSEGDVFEALTAVCFAGALWGCIDYMNAMYNLFQDQAYRKTLIWLSLAMVCMAGRKYALNKINLAWAVLGSLGAFIWYRTRSGEPWELRLDQLTAELVVAAGLLLLTTIRLLAEKIRSRVQAGEKLIPAKTVNWVFTGVLAAFFLCLVVFRNTRWWPVLIVIWFGLLYLYYSLMEEKERFLRALCNGIVLNFAVALIFSILRRPYRAWFFYRYNFIFHTVTVTAEYMTLVVAALLVKFLHELKRPEKRANAWLTGLLLSLAAALMIFTLSRTGFLACIVMGVFVMIFVSLVCYRDKILLFLAKSALVLVLCAAGMPVMFTALRLVPVVYDDPFLFELEDWEEEWAIHTGDIPDSHNYITLSRFAYCFDVKLFGDEHRVMRVVVDDWMGGKRLQKEAAALQALEDKSVWLVSASEEEAQEEAAEAVQAAQENNDNSGKEDTAEEFSNGRIEIFKRYISHWNLTGHDEMGVELANGELSVHAHDTYLQVIHDHGLITGAIYVLLGLIALVCMLWYTASTLRNQEEKDPYAAVMPAIFVAYAVAGLVEWLFHPCNPLGFGALAVLAPLVTARMSNPAKKENKRKN